MAEADADEGQRRRQRLRGVVGVVALLDELAERLRRVGRRGAGALECHTQRRLAQVFHLLGRGVGRGACLLDGAHEFVALLRELEGATNDGGAGGEEGEALPEVGEAGLGGVRDVLRPVFELPEALLDALDDFRRLILGGEDEAEAELVEGHVSHPPCVSLGGSSGGHYLCVTPKGEVIDMATKMAVNAGSKFCRDCGGPIRPGGSYAYCANTSPKADCLNLRAAQRVHCEHCGALTNHGPCPNPKCRLPPLVP